MTKTDKALKWRLHNLPSPQELRDLVKDEILTKDEARDILFSQEDKADPVTLQDLKKELDLLRELVLSVSRGQQTITLPTTIVKIIRENKNPWIYPYYNWSSGYTMNTSATGGSMTALFNQAIS